ncbi:MAG: phytanoyl-CoA dioxygenase family protein [Alphaproteobacteria bacterium]|nr:phytanoyl-CoA dioxygenase family protein [Alphaproteobacteria bacterium]
MSADTMNSSLLSIREVASYRRDGYVVVSQLIGPKLVAAGIDAISGLASGRLSRVSTEIFFEPGVDASRLRAEESQDHIRKFARFVDDSPALHAVAMSRRLHSILDQLLGQGRVLFQDMALIKPPRIGGAKLWHQDASYFRVSDPNLIVGVWIALDPATRENGCMEVIPGSHLDGPAIHLPDVDVNQCTIRPDQLRLRDRAPIEMAPGDALIFHALLHHYTAPNQSSQRRRAVQFHYHQLGMQWTSLDAHRRHFHDEFGAYAGCTIQKEPVPPGKQFTYVDGRELPIVPIDDWG